MAKRIDMTGQRFGEYAVIDFSHTSKEQSYWNVVCSCGNKNKVLRSSLVRGRSKSCGCKRTKLFLESNSKERTHNRNGEIIKTSRGVRGEDREAAILKACFRTSIRDRKSFSGSDLSYADWKRLVTSSACHYCGTLKYAKTLKDRGRNGKLVSDTVVRILGVDRVDNTKPYTVTNCVPCCPVCNMMKGELSKDEFSKHIDRLHQHPWDINLPPDTF